MELKPEQNRYVVSYLDSKSEALLFSVSRILNKHSASAQIDANIIRIIQIISEVDSVLEKIGTKDISYNKFFELLMQIQSCDIPEVNLFLKKYSYDNLQKNIEIERPKEEYVDCEKVIRSAILKKINISYEEFEKNIKQFANEIFIHYYNGANCKIVDSIELDGKESYSVDGQVFLCRELVQKLYYSGDYRIVKNIFHEACHVKQFKRIKIDNEYDKFLLKQIKEEIISYYYPNYYNDNYSRISFETEAELFAITEFLKLIKKFGIEFKDGKHPFTKSIENILKFVSDNSRITANGIQSIDEIFDSIVVHHKEVFDMYPQLMREYEILFGGIISKKNSWGRNE